MVLKALFGHRKYPFCILTSVTNRKIVGFEVLVKLAKNNKHGRKCPRVRTYALHDLTPRSIINLSIRKVYSQFEKTKFNNLENIRLPQLAPELVIFNIRSTSFEFSWGAAENFTADEGRFYPKYGFTATPMIRFISENVQISYQ